MSLAADDVVAVGDNLETDIPAGAGAGIRTMLILTGVSARADAENAAVRPTWIAANYREVERIVLG
jgi:ribonucleotide monophosphatase NagD (HAD superfamily)